MIASAVCNTYIELGVNAFRQGFPDVADKMLQAALEEAQRLSSKAEPTGAVFHKLAYLYYQQRDYNKAEAVYHQAVTLYERLFDADDANLSNVILNLAELYFAQHKYEQAAPLYERALAIDEKRLGKAHPLLERRILKLAFTYCTQQRFADADKLYKRVKVIRDTRAATVA